MYAKLFSRIAQSSLMEEKVTTRYVFMMMLAIADRHGDVIGTDIAIARTMNVTPEEFSNSVGPLLSPDPSSNSQAEEGRRLVPSENGRGYRIVNYSAYRDMKSDEEKREYMRNYMRERRASKDPVKPVKNCKTPSTDVTHTEAEAEAEADTKKREKKIMPDSAPSLVDDLWKAAHPKSRNRSSKAQVAEMLAKSKPSPDRKTILASITKWSACHEWTRDGGEYAQGLHLWIKRRRWESDPDESPTQPELKKMPWE